MAWGKAGSTTKSSASQLLDTTISSNKTNMLLRHIISSGNTAVYYKFNSSTGNEYSFRSSENESNDGETPNTSRVLYDTGGDAGDKFDVTYSVNIATEEKLFIAEQVNSDGSGASTAPIRGQFCGKWNNTTDLASTVNTFNTDQSGNYNTGSNVTVLGSDLTPASAVTFPTNVQVGSRAEITDSRKMYNYSDVSTSELKAYYKFDESSGNIINQATSVGSSDSLGTDADMTISGATYSQTGKIGNALSFDGSNDFGTLGSSLSQWNLFHGTGDWTLNYWINFGAFTSEAKIFSNLDSTETRGINVRVGGSDPDGTIGLSIKSDNGFMVNTGSISFNQTLSTGTWYMITLTCDHSLSSANYQVSVNGTGQGTANRSVLGSGNNAEHSTKIMRRGGSSDGFVNADIDEMSIWNRLLTADEITSLYNSNSGRAISSGIFTEWKEIGA